jgi:uncharacterized membrane protein YkoI
MSARTKETEMTRNKKIVAVVASVLALGAGGAAIAGATGAGPLGDDDGSEKPIDGAALEQASAAALAHTGEGTVSDTEVGDEESYYEVEVTLDDGSQTDVQLDRDFNVVGDEADDESEDEKGGE